MKCNLYFLLMLERSNFPAHTKHYRYDFLCTVCFVLAFKGLQLFISSSLITKKTSQSGLVHLTKQLLIKEACSGWKLSPPRLKGER